MGSLGDLAKQMAAAPKKDKKEKDERGVAGTSNLGEALKQGLEKEPDVLKEVLVTASKESAPGGLPGNPIAEMFDRITFELPNTDKAYPDERNKNKSSKTGAFVSLHSALVTGFVIKATIRIDLEKGMDEEGPFEDSSESFKWYSKSFGRDSSVEIDKAYPDMQIHMLRFQEYVVDMYRNWRADIALKTAQAKGPVHVPKGVTRTRPPKEEVPAPAPK